MEHPCKDCTAYIIPGELHSEMNCLAIGTKITTIWCNYISAAVPVRAQRLIAEAKEEMIREEWQKAGLQGVRLLVGSPSGISVGGR